VKVPLAGGQTTTLYPSYGEPFPQAIAVDAASGYQRLLGVQRGESDEADPQVSVG
jgi:hypothetical protein